METKTKKCVRNSNEWQEIRHSHSIVEVCESRWRKGLKFGKVPCFPVLNVNTDTVKDFFHVSGGGGECYPFPGGSSPASAPRLERYPLKIGSSIRSLLSFSIIRHMGSRWADRRNRAAAGR